MAREWLCSVLLFSSIAWSAEPPVEAVERAETPDPAERAAAEAAFTEVAKVLQSPRCLNCHPAGDAPLQGDQSRPHRMQITRDSAAVGLPCTTCHRPQAYDAPHLPPGNPVWHLAPEEQVFEGVSVDVLCQSLRDPARNGGRDLDALLEHVSHDPLVLWGWTPGGGRSTPPLTHEAFVKAFTTWTEAGAPCRE